MQAAKRLSPALFPVLEPLEAAESVLRSVLDGEPPADVADAFFAALDLAAEAPGGWNLLIEGIRASGRAEEVVAFCRAFTMVMASANNTIEDAHCVHDPVYAL